MAWQEFACPSCNKGFRFKDAPLIQHATCPACREVVTIPAARPWYYARGRQKIGPLALDGLRSLAGAGRLAPTDMVWQEGTTRWLPAAHVPGLFAAAAPAAPARRLLPVVLAVLLLTAVTATVAVVSWHAHAPAEHGTGKPTATASAEPVRERLPAPREEAPPTPEEQPTPPAPTPPTPPAPPPANPTPPAPALPSTERTLLFPADGQTQVPLEFTGGPEVPSADPNQPVRAGYPITVTFRPGVTVRGVTARLLDPDDEEVKVWLSTPEKPAVAQRQGNSICLIAQAPLQPGTLYRALVRARVGGQDWTREWSFTTAKDRLPDASLTGRALARVNSFRAQAGLEPVTLDTELSNGCRAHCAYLARNARHPSTQGLGGHNEDPALPGYSEEGRRAGKASVIAWGDVEPLAAIDGWMATLFHRIPMLDPNLKRIGFGHARRGSGWVTALDVLRGREPGPAGPVVLYPGPDQKGVPLVFPSGEEPNPIPLAKSGRGGFPITATFPSSATLTKMAFTLKDGTGKEVPVWFSSPEQPANPKYARYQGTTVCLIAKEPLRPATTYSVRGAGQVDGQPWTREWSFTTGTGARGADFAAEVLAQINAYRRAVGLPSVALDPGLSKGCAAHAAYLVLNADHPAVQGAGVLREDPALPGYSPEGLAAARNADVLSEATTPLMHAERMMGTLLRRLHLLDPSVRRIGFGCAQDAGRGWVCVLDLSRGRDPGAASLGALPSRQLASSAR
jgi:uncharacterized protein YkwD